MLKENTLFANRYNLLHLIGIGGFSEVWLAKDQMTSLEIALKVYAPGQGIDNDGLSDFCAELANIYNLNHSNLLKPQHVDSFDNMPYLIMPFCPNGSLKKRIGKVSEDEMWKIIEDVASGLAYLHSLDIIHRDIKPDNVLQNEHGDYLITDFGISTRSRSTLRKSMPKANEKSGSGTIAYMAPECFSDHPLPVKASDIWALGAMCFELIMGYVPFGDILGGAKQKSGSPIPQIEANVSEQLKSLITSMMQLETWDRPKAVDIVHLVKNRQEIQNPQISGQPTVPITEPIKPKKSSGKYLIVFIIALLIGGGIGGGMYFNKQQKRISLMKEWNTTKDEYGVAFSHACMSIDSIDALERAYAKLDLLDIHESNSLFREKKRYSEYKKQLDERADVMYDELMSKYQTAPASSSIKQHIYNKMNRISKQKIRH
ncbi:MAG: serine/threonine protein kinase [Paludibacteraceae bacterium]|nr:serine/threonine protein kinase [Paludibacteraceae bacterium]